jgi:hypothetical protein
VRADVDRPKPTFMLHERDKRIHGLKPFQELVDAAPAGSTLKPPPAPTPARSASTSRSSSTAAAR